MLCRPTNSTQGGTEKDRKGLGTEDWGLATRAMEPGTGTDKQTDRMTDKHFLPPLQTSQSRTRVYNSRTIPGRKYILTCLVQGKETIPP
jgi:hypothetical protein